MPLVVVFATSDLGSLHSTHLRDPRRSRLDLADGADLIAGVAGNADVVATLESELDVADLEDLATALLGVLASGRENLVDEVVCNVEDGLQWLVFGAKDRKG